MAQTRTAKSLINSSVSLIFYAISLCITVFSRPIVFGVLGAEISGMRDTMGNFLGTLNLAELGVGVAIGYALYKPLHDKDTEIINEIMSIQAWLYRRIALFVTLGAIILVACFPIIIKDFDSPMWYVYLTFIIFFWETLMSYLVNYRSIIFGADQRGYRLSINMQGFYISKNILQLLMLYYSADLGISNPYLYYMILEFIVSLIGIYVLETMIKKDYPWLKAEPKNGRALLKKHKEIGTKIKQIFFHKFAGVALNHISPSVIYIFTDFYIVAYYLSYRTLAVHISSLISTSFASIGAGIGNLVAEGNKGKIMKFFWEFGALKAFSATIASFAFYSFSSYLIPLWVGDDPKYIIPNVIVALISLNIYLWMTRFMDVYLNAYGMYQDIWAPVVEAVINILGGIGLAFVFYHNYTFFGFVSADYAGLAGVLIGSQLSILIIVFGWKSIFLFREGFKLSPRIFWSNYLKYPIVSMIFIVAGSYALDYLALDFSTIPSFLFNGIWTTAVFSVILFAFYYAMSQGMRDITERFWIIFTEKMLPKMKQKIGM